jgi:hypothetical protein
MTHSGPGMKEQMRTLSIAFILSLTAIGASSQTADSIRPPTGSPLLKLRIVPSKTAYTLKETVLAKTVFTNVSDQTLCFPKPSQEIKAPEQGYLEIQALGPPGAPGSEQFIEGIDGGGAWPREKLLSDIRKNWVKLAANGTYATDFARVHATLGEPGQWQLKETYQPPEGSFDAGYRKRLKSSALSVGCALPDTPVSTEPITINIVSPSERK